MLCFSKAMRTVLPSSVLMLSVLFFAFCVGCQQTIPQPDVSLPGGASESGAIKPPPLILPLEPLSRPSGESEESFPGKTNPGEDTKEEPTGIIAKTFEKYTGEVVPLPPIDDLTAQIDEYISKIGSNLAYLDGSRRYAEDAADIVRDASALALVALGVGLADADSKYKPSALHIIAAAKNLVNAKNFDEGKKGYDALKASLTDTTAGASLSWSDKVADLAPLMKALPNLSTAVKRVTDTENKINVTLDRRKQAVFSQLATLAIISQGSIPNVIETTKPDAVAEWKRLCEEFRDASLKVNAAARQYAQDKADGKQPDYGAFKTHFNAMTESCDHCHEVFYPSALGTE